MANVQGFTRSAVGHILAHIERLKNKAGEYIKFGNQNIDTSRTGLNYTLFRDEQNRPVRPMKRYKEIIGQVHKLNKRSDLRTLCSWVITAPKDLRPKDENRFFRLCYKYLHEKYPYTVAAGVHRDETTPHMHYAFCPCFRDKEGNLRLSAREVLSRAELLRFHGELAQYVEQGLGYRVSIETGEQSKKNLSIIAKQIKHAMVELQQLLDEQQVERDALDTVAKQVAEMHSQYNNLLQNCNLLEQEKTDLQKQVNDLSTQIMRQLATKNDMISNFQKEAKQRVIKELGRVAEDILADDEPTSEPARYNQNRFNDFER